jgi:hypothetical protein
MRAILPLRRDGSALIRDGFLLIRKIFFLRRKNFVVWGAKWRCGFASGGLRSKTPRLDPAHPVGVLPRKGLEGFSHGAAGAGARERGAPQSPVFGAAENAPKLQKKLCNRAFSLSAVMVPRFFSVRQASGRGLGGRRAG